MNQNIEQIAGQLYDVYCAAVGGKAFNGDPLPAWAEFSKDPAKKKQADAWRTAARVNDATQRLIREHRLAVESLTENQLAEAIRQALACGDFVRHVVVGSDAQQVCYVPYAQYQEISTKYDELLYAVERKTEGETRHETALRYIRETEARALQDLQQKPKTP